MGRLTIGSRVFLVSLFLVLAGVTISSTISSLAFVKAMGDEIDDTILVAVNGMRKEIDSILGRMKLFGQTFRNMPELADLVVQGNSTRMNQWLRPYMDVPQFDFIIVTDARGNVLSRPHDPYRIGDNVSQREYVAPSLKGESSVTLGKGGTTNLGLFHSVPIEKDSRVIGALIVGIDLYKPDIVDSLAGMYRTEATLYYGDRRINTTLRKDGQRVLETKAPPGVADAVLGKGDLYHGEFTIPGGATLRTLYRPFIFNGERVGILAAGVPTRVLDEAIRSAVYRVAVSAAIFILLAMVASYLFAKNIAKLSSEKTQQEIFLDLLMKNTPDAILLLDKEGKLIDCSSVFLHQPQANGAGRSAGR
ncbi:MAG: cache domain-containing protein, partial [Synergistaceae bacterium]|nr:cache domain-containing protein [Synergistaceae bacterium]